LDESKRGDGEVAERGAEEEDGFEYLNFADLSVAFRLSAFRFLPLARWEAGG
jgi:hypothetical protein